MISQQVTLKITAFFQALTFSNLKAHLLVWIHLPRNWHNLKQINWLFSDISIWDYKNKNHKNQSIPPTNKYVEEFF